MHDFGWFDSSPTPKKLSLVPEKIWHGMSSQQCHMGIFKIPWTWRILVPPAKFMRHTWMDLQVSPKSSSFNCFSTVLWRFFVLGKWLLYIYIYNYSATWWVIYSNHQLILYVYIIFICNYGCSPTIYQCLLQGYLYIHLMSTAGSCRWLLPHWSLAPVHRSAGSRVNSGLANWRWDRMITWSLQIYGADSDTVMWLDSDETFELLHIKIWMVAISKYKNYKELEIHPNLLANELRDWLDTSHWT